MIIHDPTCIDKKSSEVSCYEKDKTSSMVDNVDKGSKSLDDLKSVYDGIQNIEITGSNNIRDDNTVNQDGTLTLRFIEKSDGDLVEENPMNCKQPTKKQLRASASEIPGS